MRKLSLLLILIFTVACGGENVAPTTEPVALPTTAAPANLDVEDGTNTSVESPRGEVVGEESGLPPTFTPMPTIIRDSGAEGVGVNSTGTPTSISPNAGETYTIQAGDTLAGIAAEYGVSVDALAQANGIVDIDEIEVGQVIRIP